MELLTTNQVAERLGVSERRIRAMIAEGKLQAHQLGREYAIESGALVGVRTYGKPGRPPKPKPGAEGAAGQATAGNGAPQPQAVVVRELKKPQAVVAKAKPRKKAAKKAAKKRGKGAK